MPESLPRRDVILRAAAELFADKGVAATTVREIAEAVGILSGSLYHHFPSKDAVVTEIVTSYLDDLRAGYSAVLSEAADPRTRLRGLVLASFLAVEAHPHAAEIYQNDGSYLRGLDGYGHLKRAADEVQHTWIEAIEAGVASGMFRSDVPVPVFYRLMRDAVWLSVRWFRPSAGYSVERLAEDCTSVFLDGFAATQRASR